MVKKYVTLSYTTNITTKKTFLALFSVIATVNLFFDVVMHEGQKGGGGGI